MKTIQKPTYLFILFLLTINSQAQINHIGFHVPDTIFNEHPFQQLDSSSYITSGVLWDRIKPNFDFESFKGGIDDRASNSRLFHQAYYDIRAAFIENNSFKGYDSYLETYDNQAMASNALPIVCYALEYQKLKNHALDSGLINIVDSQFVINPNHSENPFVSQYLWQISSKADEVPINQSFQVVLSKNLAILNLPNKHSIHSMSIDFDDGLGYRSVFWDSIAQVEYLGEGNEDKLISLKFSTNSGSIFYAQLKWKTAASSNACFPIVDDAPWPDDVKSYFYQTGNTVKHITQPIKNLVRSSTAFQNEYGFGKVYIKYHSNGVPKPQQFNKPLIFIEGIDFEPPYVGKSSYDPLKNSIRLGNVGWPTLWGCDVNYPFQKSPAYLDSLRHEGYDIIMLDFYDGADYMQRNAHLLIEVINRVNQNKIGDEQIVLMGASMGGQIARWALTYMETNNMDHCVRLFCSFDSPWKGANIPLAMQSFVKYMAEDGEKSSVFQKLKDLRRPATKQMLLYHIDQCDARFATKTLFGKKKWDVAYNFPNKKTFAPDPLFDQFYQEVREMGDFPKKCRNVAMINGNNQGIKEFSDGKKFLHFEKTCWTFKNKAILFAGGAANYTVSNLNTAGFFKEIWEKRYRAINAENLDNSPGGYRGDFLLVQKEISEFTKEFKCHSIPLLLHNEASFVPAASALALTNNDWFYKIDNQINDHSSFLSGITEFESFFAPATNEQHVEVTDENMVWLLNQIRKGEKKLENHNGGILTKTWNNPLENKHISGLHINKGGNLYINSNKPIYDEVPDPLGKNFPPPGSVSKVILGSPCSFNHNININSGGKLILGDNNFKSLGGNNLAEVHVGSGSILNINSGGEIIVNKNSKLIIDKGANLSIKKGGKIDLLAAGEIIVEDGGEFEIYPSANIILRNEEALFHLKGKLSITKDATFTFSGQGKLILDQNIPWLIDASGNSYLHLDDYMKLAPGAKFKIQGNSPSDKNKVYVECRKPFYLKDGSGGIFEEVDILNAALELQNGALFFSFGKTFISNATITSDGGIKHQGFRLWNNGSYNLIRNTDIKNGDIGIFAQGFTGGNNLNFENCHFINNKTALKINGGSFNFSNGNFFNNSFDIKADALSGESKIHHSQFDHSSLTSFTKSIILTGQRGSLLSIDNCVFKNHSTFIRSVGIDLRSDCSEYNGSDVAINLEDGILFINGEAGNLFKQNISQSILLTGNTTTSGIYLKNGHNTFEKDNNQYNRYFRHIDGYYPNSIPQSEFMPNNIDIDADFNSFDIYKPFNHPENFFFLLSYTHNTPTYHDIIFNTNFSNADCNSGNTLDDEHPLGPVIEGYPSEGGYVFNKEGENLSLKQAALNGVEQLSLVENEKDYIAALNIFMSILNSNIGQADASTDGLLKASYKGMFNALNNAYQYEQLVNSKGENISKPNELMGVIEIIDHKINPLAPYLDSNVRPSYFQLHLDKVQAYRLSGFYPEALEILDQLGTWTFDNTQEQKAGYWDCVCNAEFDFHSGDLKEESFMYQMDQCQMKFTDPNHKTQREKSFETKEVPLIFEYHPQPAHGELKLFIQPEIRGKVEMTICDLSGRQLSRKKLEWQGNSQQLDIHFLKKGTYLIRFEKGDFLKIIKVIKT